MIIPLAPLLPVGSSNQPESSDGPPSNALLFGLAPGGACLAPDVATETGELLPHRFTLTPPLARRSAFCCAFLLVAETGRYPAPCPVEPGLSSRLSPQGDKPAIICPTPNPQLPADQNFQVGHRRYHIFVIIANFVVCSSRQIAKPRKLCKGSAGCNAAHSLTTLRICKGWSTVTKLLRLCA